MRNEHGEKLLGNAHIPGQTAPVLIQAAHAAAIWRHAEDVAADMRARGILARAIGFDAVLIESPGRANA